MNMRILYCEIGEHDYEAPVKRGRRPRNCPEHRPAFAMPAAHSDAGIRRIIEEAMNADQCTCPLRPDMTFDELVALEGGCCEPAFICPNLDRVRRRIGYRPEPLYDDI